MLSSSDASSSTGSTDGVQPGGKPGREPGTREGRRLVKLLSMAVGLVTMEARRLFHLAGLLYERVNVGSVMLINGWRRGTTRIRRGKTKRKNPSM